MFLKVLWPLVQEKEEGPNVNNSSNKRGRLQEQLRELGGTNCPVLSYCTVVCSVCHVSCITTGRLVFIIYSGITIMSAKII